MILDNNYCKMSSIGVSKVTNKFDESNLEDIVVSSMWNDGKLKVYIVKNNSVMLFGEEGNEQLEKYAKTFNKTLEAYVQETRDILCGSKSDVDFFLTDSKFYWKRKKWSLGQINVKPAEDIGSLIEFILTLVDAYSKNKTKLDDIEKDYQNVKLVNSDLADKLNDFQSIKEKLEDGLYKKFALVLNSKKAKIKELSEQLKAIEDKKSIFNESTDESEGEFEQKNYMSSHSSPTSSKKRTLDKNDKKSSNKRKKGCEVDNIQTEEKNCLQNSTSSNASDKQEPVPSTSKDTKNLDEDQETPDLLSGESECEFELKFDKEKIDSPVKGSAIAEEDSEEMF